jgi:hypothetical protein
MWIFVIVDLFIVDLIIDYLLNEVMLYALPNGHLEGSVMLFNQMLVKDIIFLYIFLGN